MPKTLILGLSYECLYGQRELKYTIRVELDVLRGLTLRAKAPLQVIVASCNILGLLVPSLGRKTVSIVFRISKLVNRGL